MNAFSEKMTIRRKQINWRLIGFSMEITIMVLVKQILDLIRFVTLQRSKIHLVCQTGTQILCQC